MAGAARAGQLFGIGGCAARVIVRDGDEIPRGKGARVMSVRGPGRSVLACERAALNLLSRMSGIATRTRGLAGALAPHGVRLLATRKTAPGLRLFDKEAVESGGGERHRMSLADRVIIKDNHISAAAAIRGAGRAEAIGRLVAGAAAGGRGRGEIEVEAETTGEALAAARAGAGAVMLDNFTPSRAAAAVGALKRAGLRDSVTVEASGGITEDNAERYAAAGVDCVSVGALTSAPPHVDYSLEVVRARPLPRRPALAANVGAPASPAGAQAPPRRRPAR